MKVAVYNQKGEQVGDVELNPKVFEVKPNSHLLAEAVRVQLSNSRGGTANTKTRGEVRGGGKKPWKQKGTGRARAGSTRSPIWRHGGITFGPRANRNWELKINKKAKTAALFMSLSDKVKEHQFIVVDQINLDQPKTKEFVKFLGDLKTGVKDFGKKQLLVMPKKDDKLFRGSRNLKTVTSVLANSLNILDVITANTMVVLKDSLPVIEKTYLKNSKK
jgi:large subunit ribosomal protein L4